MWVALAVAAALVAFADAVQPLILEWQPRQFGAIGGAVLYALVAGGAWFERRWAALAALLVPVLPVSILLATAVGVELPVAPDAVMVGILAIQLTAAALGAATLLRAEQEE